jgi:basic membrane lipoprotein Med (substrate-binding protein (PBP1-ABC) superfamily)
MENPAAVLPIQKQKRKDPVYEALVEMVKKGTLKSGPPNRSIEIAGTPYKMSLEQYREYFDKSSEIAHRKLESLVSSPSWEQITDKRKSEIVSGVMENARKGVRQKIKAEMARENREKAAANQSTAL